MYFNLPILLHPLPPKGGSSFVTFLLLTNYLYFISILVTFFNCFSLVSFLFSFFFSLFSWLFFLFSFLFSLFSWLFFLGSFLFSLFSFLFSLFSFLFSLFSPLQGAGGLLLIQRCYITCRWYSIQIMENFVIA
jgi:hypothetical protein